MKYLQSTEMMSAPDQYLVWKAHHPHHGQLDCPAEALPSHIKALKALGFLSHAFCGVRIQITCLTSNLRIKSVSHCGPCNATDCPSTWRHPKFQYSGPAKYQLCDSQGTPCHLKN